MRQQDQADTLVDLLHWDTSYPEGSSVLEAGVWHRRPDDIAGPPQPGARIISVDVSADSIEEARAKAAAAGLTNVQFKALGEKARSV